WAYAFHQDKVSSVRVPVANVTLFSSAQLLRENTDPVRSNQRMSPTTPFYLPLLHLVLPELWQHYQQLVVRWQPESWLVLHMIQRKFLEFKTSKDWYGDNGMSDSIRDAKTPVESSIPVSLSSSIGSSSPVRSVTPPPGYPFDKSIFAKLDNLLWIIPRPLGSKPVLEEPNESDAHL
nr:hypothetical protein [Tanacetum cinerariifolium]GFA85796.1 hypothetical protein [Tanacetum cinerariifolium]